MLNELKNKFENISLTLQLSICLGISMLSGAALAADDGPCEPTTIIKGSFFAGPASGVYSCTIKVSNNKVTAWMWRNKSRAFSDDRYREKYEFRCDNRTMKRIMQEYLGSIQMDDDEWGTPQKGTVGDKWLTFICRNAKFF